MLIKFIKEIACIQIRRPKMNKKKLIALAVMAIFLLSIVTITKNEWITSKKKNPKKRLKLVCVCLKSYLKKR